MWGSGGICILGHETLCGGLSVWSLLGLPTLFRCVVGGLRRIGFAFGMDTSLGISFGDHVGESIIFEGDCANVIMFISSGVALFYCY